MEQQISDYLSSVYNIRRLKRRELIKSFDCGDADLNDFILKESSLYRQALLAVSYVIESKQDRLPFSDGGCLCRCYSFLYKEWFRSFK